MQTSFDYRGVTYTVRERLARDEVLSQMLHRNLLLEYRERQEDGSEITDAAWYLLTAYVELMLACSTDDENNPYPIANSNMATDEIHDWMYTFWESAPPGFMEAFRKAQDTVNQVDIDPNV